jgi:alanyl aminopeptidase
MNLRLVALLLLCSGNAVAATDATLGRIGDAVRPTREDVRLVVDPSKPDYSGDVTIAVTVVKPTQDLRLHAEAMTLGKVRTRVREEGIEGDRADVDRARAGARVAARAEAACHRRLHPDDRVHERLQHAGDESSIASRAATTGTRSPSSRPTTRARRSLLRRARVQDSLERVRHRARRDMVVGNTPIERENRRRSRRPLRETRPLPSYLIALSVGPLETIPIEGMAFPGPGRHGQGRIAPGGRGGEASRRPWSALGSVLRPAVPVREARPRRRCPSSGRARWRTRARSRSPTGVAASIRAREHDAEAPPGVDHRARAGAHVVRRPGDDAWWDDLWLNESFASWMGEKVTHEVFPGWASICAWCRTRTMRCAPTGG